MKYEAPKFEVLELAADVITTSYTGPGASGSEGGSGRDD